jgi:hypothetical protein
MIGHAPKIKIMKEHGRHLRLDDEAEKRLLAGASGCEWRQRTRDLFRDIVILMRDIGMRNQRELYRMRIVSVHGVARGRRAGCFRPSALLLVTFAHSIGCSERRGNKPASRRNWSSIAPAMTMTLAFSCEPGT